MEALLTIPKAIFIITLIIFFLLGVGLGSAISLSLYLSQISKLFKKGDK